MKFKTNLAAGALVLLVALFSCKGDRGDPGPVGSRGDTGATGPTGAIGAIGPAGTANVIYSSWITGYTWIPTTYESYPAKYFKISAPALTQAVWDHGVILVYIKFPFGGGLTSIKQLPYENIVYPSIWDKYFHNAFVGSIDIICLHLNSTLSAYTNSEFRYVLIPGGVAGREATVDYSDYTKVKEFYNLPD